jgi:amino acid adenylation domain-containing protein
MERTSLVASDTPTVAAPVNTGASVCALFEQQADRTPTAVALLVDGRTLTYRELDDRVAQLARRLRVRYGVGPESIVALLLGRTERMLISMLAVLRAGGAYVPISPDYPANRIAYILNDARPRVLITEERQLPRVAGFEGDVVSWDAAPVAWAAESTDRLSDYPEERQLAYIMYTSGSTGQPKGVMLEHRNLSNFIVWCHDEYRASTFDIVYAVTPYGFDLSNIELFFPLTIGRPMRLLPSSQMIGLFLRRDRQVLINTVPSLAQELLKTGDLLHHVSVLNLGGEAVPPSLGRALRAYPRLEVRNMYGPTETTSTAINYRMDGQASTEILIGTPIANTIVYILDEELRPVPDGSKGEICIGGAGLTRGYLNRPELTRARFVDDPFRTGERMYRTGDIGARLPDGNLQYFGRNDNQVKIRGYRVELDEIGSQLSRHPAVREAVVGLRHDRLVAFVSAENGGADPRTLAAFLREHLPPYMVPDEFVAVDAFPLTPSGKIDRAALLSESAHDHQHRSVC